MAIAIPLIAGAVASAASATAAVATMWSIGAGLVAGATGISAKVDKAASKVFGKDVVKAFNIAGTIYGAFGGFSGQGPSQVWDNVTSTFTGAGASAGAEAAASGLAEGATEAATAPAMDLGFEAMTAAPEFGTAGGGLVTGGIDQGMTAANPWAQPVVAGAAPMAPAGPAPVGGQGQPSAIAKMWESLGPQGKAMAIYTGGQMLAGLAQGKAQEEAMDREAEERARRGQVLGVRWGRPSAVAAYNQFYAKPAGG